MHKQLFIPAPFFFLRTSMWPIEKCYGIFEQQNWIDAIFNLYETEEIFREAIAIASPSLQAALQKNQNQRTESIAISLFNYAARMASRAIPFGLFSFVAMGSWDEKTQFLVDLNCVSKRARPDMSWIYALIQKSYKDESLSLPIKANPLLRVSGERIYLSYVRNAEKETSATSKIFSIRATNLVRSILVLAKEPKEISMLCDELLNIMPSIDKEKLIGVIHELFSQQFLLPSLMPSLFNATPFKDLLPYLSDSVSLDFIARAIEKYNQTPVGEGLAILEELQQQMSLIAPAKTYLQVDSVYKGPPLQLPQDVGEEAALAATFLWNISRDYSITASLIAYHAKFIEKYGTHRTISLIDLLSDERGIGLPENLQSVPPPKLESRFTKQWEKWLRQKWQECLREKQNEIVINENVIDYLFSLAGESPRNPEDVLLSTDTFCKLIADSSEHVSRGEFLIQFIQSTTQGGNSIGRFIDLLSEKAKTEFERYIHAEEDLEKETLFVEIAFWPPNGHNANVAIHPCFRKYRLDIQAKKHDPNSLSIEDIYVGATHERLYLTLKEGGSEILVRVGNLLNPSLAPVPLQFMREVSQSKHQILSSFPWGHVQKDAIFLPRVRFKRTILSPARWYLEAQLFQKEKAKKISDGFSEWAERWALPRHSFLVKGDQHLLIDRYHPAHFQEIVHKLTKGESLQFVENIGNPWMTSEKGHHFSEIIIPLLKNPIYPCKNPIVPQPHFPISIDQRFKLLGSEWVFIKLYLARDETNKFIVQHLASFAKKLHQETNIAGWFFVQYRDPEWHVRFRIRLTNPESLSFVIFSLKEASLLWMKAGLIKDMTFASYEREVERYGGPELIEAAELIFCKDSLATVNLLQNIANKKLKLTEPVIHALSVISFLKGFDLSIDQIVQLLNVENDKKTELKGFRDCKVQLIAFVQAWERGSFVEDLECFIHASQMRKGAQTFFQSQAQNLPSDALHSSYNSLLHMHCNRMGCDTYSERRARLYAAHTLMQFKKIV